MLVHITAGGKTSSGTIASPLKDEEKITAAVRRDAHCQIRMHAPSLFHLRGTTTKNGITFSEEGPCHSHLHHRTVTSCQLGGGEGVVGERATAGRKRRLLLFTYAGRGLRAAPRYKCIFDSSMKTNQEEVAEEIKQYAASLPSLPE